MAAADKKPSTRGTDGNDAEMPLISHLKELRDRILRCLYSVIVVFLALVYFSKDIYEFIAAPMIAAMPEGTQMIAVDVATPFLAPFKLTLWVSFVIAMPMVLYQVWSFIAPALYRNEKRVAIPLFVSSVILFYSGIAFAYYVVFGMVFQFFISIAPDIIAVMPDINSYLGFILKLFFAFGITFEVPVATVLLIWAGIISPEGLVAKRPYIIVGCLVVAMLLTPADVYSMILLAIPMWMLFEVGVFFGRWVHPVENEKSANNNSSVKNT